ncbi:hypothetical protein NORO109296_25005 [Nocardiopsis rhodophaea]
MIPRTAEWLRTKQGESPLGRSPLRAAFTQVMAGAARGDLVIDTEAVPLSQVTDAWDRDTKGARLVLVP